MFNVKVFKLKDLIKYFVVLLLIITLIFIVVKIIFNNKDIESTNKNTKEGFLNFDLISCIDATCGIIKSTNRPTDVKIKAYKSDLYEDILKSQIGMAEEFNDIKATEASSVASEKSNDEEVVKLESDTKVSNVENSNNVELAQTELNTEIITNNPISLNFNAQYGNVKIKNETSHELTEEMMNPNINIDNKNILLFHTHTCESYTSSEQFKYTPTGNYRTTDLNFTVVRVGDELEKHLKAYGYNVIHDRTYHDYPSYNGSYTSSLQTVQNILNSNPTDIIFDIHRDAIGSRSDYAPSVKIGDDVAAQIMFVVGSDEGGLWHPNWIQNLKFAIKVQAKAEEMYPGLFKPITLTKYRYNQHSGKYASIIEVGATGNTMEQCLNSMKYLGKVLAEVMK